MAFTVREQIVEVVNKLFVHTDNQEWNKLQDEVFTPIVFLDMKSVGGEASEMTSKQICDQWKVGFKGIDSINHLAGNHLVTIYDEYAEVFAYATATHFNANATKGQTREFVGSYDIHLVNTDIGWRIDRMRYNLKYTQGNMTLE